MPPSNAQVRETFLVTRSDEIEVMRDGPAHHQTRWFARDYQRDPSMTAEGTTTGTMVVEGHGVMKQLRWIGDSGRPSKTSLSVFPPDPATRDMIAWLRDNPSAGRDAARRCAEFRRRMQ